MSWLSAVANIAGVAVSAYGAYSASQQAEETGETNAAEVRRAAAANAEISRYDASVAELEAFRAEWRAGIELKNHMLGVDRLIGRQRARLGKSCVVLSKGSASEIVRETARLAKIDSQMIVNNGKTARDTALSAAHRYKLLASKGLRDAAATASIITAAAQDRSDMYLMQGISSAVSGLANLADQQGWF
ncbi:MAG: hypothetical protein P8Y36_14360 [Alphaproteobacteria bacterium]